MARKLQEVNLEELSQAVRAARAKKGWTLEQLSHELWDRGLPTAQNKLWRLENNPPKRIDTELLLWLEKVLDVELLDQENKTQVFIEDVVELIDAFIGVGKQEDAPDRPSNGSLREIYEKLQLLVQHQR